MAAHEKPRPIHSTLADDPAACEAIDAFVVVLAERVDDLQDAEAQRDYTGLAERAAALADEAARVGYEALVDCARRVGDCCHRQATDEARKALVELTELAQRIRLGHRGAV